MKTLLLVPFHFSESLHNSQNRDFESLAQILDKAFLLFAKSSLQVLEIQVKSIQHSMSAELLLQGLAIIEVLTLHLTVFFFIPILLSVSPLRSFIFSLSFARAG